MISPGDDLVTGATNGFDEPMSRQRLFRLGAAVVVGAAGWSWLAPSARADDGGSDNHAFGAPRPIPGGFNADLSDFVPKDPLIHALAPIVGLEMSTITDFKGVVAAGEVQGDARGSDGKEYWFDVDMRFMQGDYIDLRGRRREHAFGFV